MALVAVGKESLMIAADATTLAELNERARSDWIVTGYVTEDGLVLHGGSTVGVGDEVVTRENNWLLATGKGRVKNGDRWMVTATSPTPRRPIGPEEFAAVETDDVAQTGPKLMFHQVPEGKTV
jgi:hypothetical protein